MSAITYWQAVQEISRTIVDTQLEAISPAARAIADSIERGGVLHVFGSGHSHMVAEDVFYRAGGLACVDAMLEFPLMELNVGRSTEMERLHGYAEVLVSGYRLEAGEVAVVVSNSGINAVPIEVAQACKSRGLTVVAIVSKRHSESVASRHRDGLKLTDVADVVIDNCGVPGDAALATGGDFPVGYGPTSTLTGILIMQMIVAEVVSLLEARGFKPPMFSSANGHGAEGNAELVRAHQKRIRYFPKA
ncbi:sugar isomerase domain-containing protein [Cohnella hongkongensis]|uniref:Sugar isomerase domain-containing protein n=1 Tax=Cohnella hongkongensis TaxID=178337 RepID=A0ABV9F8M8_9BACL